MLKVGLVELLTFGSLVLRQKMLAEQQAVVSKTAQGQTSAG